MKVTETYDSPNYLLEQKESKLGSAKLFLIKVDINKQNNNLKSPNSILGTLVSSNLPENLYETVTDAINRENSIAIDRMALEEVASFQETIFKEDIDRNIQESHLTSEIDQEDYSKMAVAILINDEAVAYANYQDVYNKTHAKESVSKEELLRLREILQDNKEKKVLVQDSEVERRIK